MLCPVTPVLCQRVITSIENVVNDLLAYSLPNISQHISDKKVIFVQKEHFCHKVAISFWQSDFCIYILYIYFIYYYL